jgi:hypothetical protein
MACYKFRKNLLGFLNIYHLIDADKFICYLIFDPSVQCRRGLCERHNGKRNLKK